MEQNKSLGLLSLARKGGNIVLGEEQAGAAARASRARLMLLASDAGGHTVRRAKSFVAGTAQPLLTLPYTRDELGDALGTTSCAIAAITDVQLALAFVKTLGEPEKYADLLQELDERVREIMDTVGLPERYQHSYPHELDGGRRQRIGIGRALALNPKFIVCDEPVSALDVSIQAQILNLMMDLQEKYRLTYIFVTHDLSVVKHISDDIMVMYLGVMVEKTSSEELFSCQLHPYTKALLSAIPIAKPNLDRKRIALKGELTSPIEPPKMCRFAPRCPYATERCFQEEPALEEVLPQHFVSCHRVKEINQL